MVSVRRSSSSSTIPPPLDCQIAKRVLGCWIMLLVTTSSCIIVVLNKILRHGTIFGVQYSEIVVQFPHILGTIAVVPNFPSQGKKRGGGVEKGVNYSLKMVVY